MSSNPGRGRGAYGGRNRIFNPRNAQQITASSPATIVREPQRDDGSPTDQPPGNPSAPRYTPGLPSTQPAYNQSPAFSQEQGRANWEHEPPQKMPRYSLENVSRSGDVQPSFQAPPERQSYESALPASQVSLSGVPQPTPAQNFGSIPLSSILNQREGSAILPTQIPGYAPTSQSVQLGGILNQASSVLYPNPQQNYEQQGQVHKYQKQQHGQQPQESSWDQTRQYSRNPEIGGAHVTELVMQSTPEKQSAPFRNILDDTPGTAFPNPLGSQRGQPPVGYEKSLSYQPSQPAYMDPSVTTQNPLAFRPAGSLVHQSGVEYPVSKVHSVPAKKVDGLLEITHRNYGKQRFEQRLINSLAGRLPSNEFYMSQAYYDIVTQHLQQYLPKWVFSDVDGILRSEEEINAYRWTWEINGCLWPCPAPTKYFLVQVLDDYRREQIKARSSLERPDPNLRPLDY